MNATAKKTTAHSNCAHEATKTARAKCRAARKIVADETRERLVELAAGYYGNTLDSDEIIYALGAIDPALIEGYYDNTRDVEEIITSALH